MSYLWFIYINYKHQSVKKYKNCNLPNGAAWLNGFSSARSGGGWYLLHGNFRFWLSLVTDQLALAARAVPLLSLRLRFAQLLKVVVMCYIA